MFVYDPPLSMKLVGADLKGDLGVVVDVLDPVGLVSEL